NEKAAGQRHERQIFRSSRRDGSSREDETEKRKDRKTRRPKTEEAGMVRDELVKLSNAAEVPGRQKKGDANEPRSAGAQPPRDDRERGAEKEHAERIKRDQLRVERSRDQMRRIGENQLTPRQDVEKSRARMMKSVARILTESFAEMFGLDHLKRIGRVVVAFILAAVEDQLRVIQEHCGEKD